VECQACQASSVPNLVARSVFRLYDACPYARDLLRRWNGLKSFLASPYLEDKVEFVEMNAAHVSLVFQ
jgi:hypothetical protein